MTKITIKLNNEQLSQFTGHVLGYNLGKKYSGRKNHTLLDDVMIALERKLLPKCASLAKMDIESFYEKAEKMIINDKNFNEYTEAQENLKEH